MAPSPVPDGDGDIPIDPNPINPASTYRRKPMADTFLPTKEPELVIWYNNFQLKFAAYAPHCRTARNPPLSPPLFPQ